MERKNLIILDSWTAGIRNYDPIVKSLSDKFNVILIHNEKLNLFFLNNDVKNNVRNVFNNRKKYNRYYYKICDISEYRYSINNLIKLEKPIALITISYHGIFQRWANLIFRYKRIPAFYFMHGITGSGFRNNKIKIKNVKKNVIRFLFYAIMITLYFVDTRRSGLNRSIKYWIGYIHELIFAHHTYSWGSKFREDMIYNTAFIIQESDKDILCKLFAKETEYIITGHIDNYYIFYDTDSTTNIKENKIILISQPLFDIIGFNKILNIIRKLKIHCERRSITFIVRRHPNDDENFIKLLYDSDITISLNDNLSEIGHSIGLVGFNSTLLLQAIAMKIPILNLTHPSIISFDSISAYENASFYNIEDENDNVIDDFIDNCINSKDKNYDINIITNPVTIIEKYFEDRF